MKKSISEMTLEELYELFPVVLKEHSPQYKEWYEIEKQNILKNINADDIIRINHIGSSAVKGLLSKPTVDILLEVDGGCNISRLIDDIQSTGWGLMTRGDEPMGISFSKGYTRDGFADKVYHLHVKYFGNWDELYFRDYLITHPDIADEYGKLKLNLLKDFEYLRDEYTKAKTEFVMKYSKMAKCELQNKYKPTL